MADLVIQRVQLNKPVAKGREASNTRQAAKKAGINIPKMNPSLPEVEQEASDID